MVRPLFVAVFLAVMAPTGVLGVYYGKLIGKIETYAHSFSGTVYAASDKSIIITNLVYDGAGPAAFFWGSTKGAALTLDGEQLPDENGSTDLLKAYRNAKVQLKLPRKITAYKSIGMYCKAFEADFGHVEIKPGFKLPTKQSLGKLNARQHNTMADEVILTDSGTMVLKGFQYSASCPGSAFFVAGPTANANQNQLTHLIHDDGQTSKLGRYDKKDVTVQLPSGHDWNEFKWFSVYCSDAKQSYADIAIDKNVAEALPLRDPSKVVPPSPSHSNSTGTAAFLGPLSMLSMFVLSLGAILAAVTLRQCFEIDNRVKTC
ncbi:hypothetical protein MRX96_029976 [Rhipicephalus microplus]